MGQTGNEMIRKVATRCVIDLMLPLASPLISAARFVA
jgi:hypothetical protein